MLEVLEALLETAWTLTECVLTLLKALIVIGAGALMF